MDEFYELQETLVIFADTLQETAKDEGTLTDTLIELNEQLGVHSQGCTDLLCRKPRSLRFGQSHYSLYQRFLFAI